KVEEVIKRKGEASIASPFPVPLLVLTSSPVVALDTAMAVLLMKWLLQHLHLIAGYALFYLVDNNTATLSRSLAVSLSQPYALADPVACHEPLCFELKKSHSLWRQSISLW